MEVNMTPFERLKFKMEGKEVDKIPNLNIAMALVAKEAGTDYSTYAQDYRKLVDGNLFCVEKYGFDVVSAISDPVREAAAFGSEIVFPENGVPYCAEPLLKDGYETEKLKIVSPYDNERTLDRIKAIEEFRKRVGGEIPIIGWVEGVLAECADLRGVSSLMMDLAEEEDLNEVMEIIFRQQCRFIDAQVKAGADIIGVGNAVASLIGPSMYEEFAFRYDKATIQYIHELGAKAKLHICGNITPLLPQLKMLEVDILDFDWMVDCQKIREITEGSNICFCGNIDPVAVMLEGTASEVEAKTVKCIMEGGEQYIAACGCEVPADTPRDNLIAMNKVLYR